MSGVNFLIYLNLIIIFTRGLNAYESCEDEDQPLVAAAPIAGESATLSSDYGGPGNLSATCPVKQHPKNRTAGNTMEKSISTSSVHKEVGRSDEYSPFFSDLKQCHTGRTMDCRSMTPSSSCGTLDTTTTQNNSAFYPSQHKKKPVERSFSRSQPTSLSKSNSVYKTTAEAISRSRYSRDREQNSAFSRPLFGTEIRPMPEKRSASCPAAMLNQHRARAPFNINQKTTISPLETVIIALSAAAVLKASHSTLMDFLKHKNTKTLEKFTKLTTIGMILTLTGLNFMEEKIKSFLQTCCSKMDFLKSISQILVNFFQKFSKYQFLYMLFKGRSST